jgi:hypothetical protein
MLASAREEASLIARRLPATAIREAQRPPTSASGDGQFKARRVYVHTGGAPGQGSKDGDEQALSCPQRIAITQSPSRQKRRSRPPTEVSPSHRARILYAHQNNLQAFTAKYGDEVGALTLTFADDVSNAQRERRFNSLATNVIRPRYGAAIVVREFHQSGRIHYHGVVSQPMRDRHQVVDWNGEAIYWRKVAVRYGFGRVEFAPVRDTLAYGRYLLKDLAKPTPDGVRVRRISYLGAQRRTRVDKETGEITKGPLPAFVRPYSESFAWANGRAKEWRRKAADFAKKMHRAGCIDTPTPAGLKAKLGSRWFLLCQDDIEQGRLYTSYADLRALAAAARLGRFGAKQREATPMNQTTHAPRLASTSTRVRGRRECAVSKGNRVAYAPGSSRSASKNSCHAHGRKRFAAFTASGCSKKRAIKVITPATHDSRAAILWNTS